MSKQLPDAKYIGQLPFGKKVLDCAVLSDGTRVLSSSSVFSAFDRPRKGMNGRLEIEGHKLPPFIAAKNLQALITPEILEKTQLISYIEDGRNKTGYAADLIPLMCELYLNARREGILLDSQQKFADAAEVLMLSFARVGIAALIDEATGYQSDRKHTALRELLSIYINEGLQKWIRTFPDAFFAQLDRLYGNAKTTARARPQYYGKFINKYIYDPLENGYVKKKLNELNIDEEGRRKAKFHQWLTERGRDILISHIWRIVGIMETCKNKEHFVRVMARKKNVSIAPELYEEITRLDAESGGQ